MELTKNWKTLSFENIQQLNQTNLILHNAVQYIAAAGRYLLKQQPDDSNTNMQWNKAENNFIGHVISSGQNFRIGLNILDLELQILSANWKVLSYYPLRGQSINEGFAFLKETLDKMLVDTRPLTLNMHYKISPLNQARNQFSIINHQANIELTKHRTNAELVLSQVVKTFANASEIRTWPHHFDTGSLIPLEQDEANELIKSIGVGYAISDAYVNEPYFYVNFWSKNPPSEIKLPSFSSAGYWHNKDWTGAILPVSSLYDFKENSSQAKIIQDFFNEAIHTILEILNIKF